MIIGKCPYCDGEIISHKKENKGKKVTLYSCSNNKVEYDEEDEMFLKTSDSTCDFKIFSNALKRYGKYKLSKSEVLKILKKEDCIVDFKSRQKKNIKSI
jgi:hypothetical protein